MEPLTERERAEVLRLHHDEGLTGYAIAKRLHVNPHHVYKLTDPDYERRNRARANRHYEQNPRYRAAQGARGRRSAWRAKDDNYLVPIGVVARSVERSRQTIRAWSLPRPERGMIPATAVREKLVQLGWVPDQISRAMERLKKQHEANERASCVAAAREATSQAARDRDRRAQEEANVRRWIDFTQRSIDLWCEGEKTSEIAAKLGTTPSTVHVRRSQLRRIGVAIPRRERGSGIQWRERPGTSPTITAAHYAAWRELMNGRAAQGDEATAS